MAIMCSKFHWEDLNTEEGVSDTNYGYVRILKKGHNY